VQSGFESQENAGMFSKAMKHKGHKQLYFVEEDLSMAMRVETLGVILSKDKQAGDSEAARAAAASADMKIVMEKSFEMVCAGKAPKEAKRMKKVLMALLRYHFSLFLLWRVLLCIIQFVQH
jgi:hypothetical protein